MPRRVPNQQMLIDNRVRKINRRSLLASEDAACLYQQNGGHSTDPSGIGQDPLASDPQKCAIRDQTFASRYPSFNPTCMFQHVANGNDQLFQEALKWFINITQRFACT